MGRHELEIYELSLLLKYSTNQEEERKSVDNCINLIKPYRGRISVKFNGRKALAYAIKGSDVVNWVDIYYTGNGDLNKKIKTLIQRDDFVLRGLITKITSKQLRSPSMLNHSYISNLF